MEVNLLQTSNLNQIVYDNELSKNNSTGIFTVPSGYIYKIDSLYLTNKYSCEIPVTVSTVIQNTSNTQIAYIVNNLPLSSFETVDIITKDRPIILLENQRLHCSPSHNYAVDIHINYSKIS